MAETLTLHARERARERSGDQINPSLLWNTGRAATVEDFLDFHAVHWPDREYRVAISLGCKWLVVRSIINRKIITLMKR